MPHITSPSRSSSCHKCPRAHALPVSCLSCSSRPECGSGAANGAADRQHSALLSPALLVACSSALAGGAAVCKRGVSAACPMAQRRVYER
ncbi:hypothetical protein FA09DRAFT_127449 [Tilletiopsis washingtonensis]|uniref:Uncharacterized protein n=1 Tax=Tilletiopsis washingtonensis TaxID=58919 RepID=A0A316Z6Q9_9BASI|nr:hypothetical protein FA09DRAFT_127449 [Tilletiopsis washingtonensis]PWN95843.1 hypothetical protein FA09DRAFT_127449 [Tilletiopsis washingtonensis]